MTDRVCTRCEGTGETVRKAFTSLEGRHWPEERRPCSSCDGRGWFPPLDIAAIMGAIKGRGAKLVRRGEIVVPTVLRASRPAYRDRKSGAPRYTETRPYYVWRIARFHGGADVTMPVAASMGVSGDPFADDLDKIADCVARAAFGTDMAGAARWGQALGYIDRVPAGLPASAYPSGPVLSHGAIKPDEEILELR